MKITRVQFGDRVLHDAEAGKVPLWWTTGEDDSVERMLNQFLARTLNEPGIHEVEFLHSGKKLRIGYGPHLAPEGKGRKAEFQRFVDGQ
ncbi:hypothetical protein AB0I81_15775 [Nonomuraea sp. NPDC050404]|uniref:hypothetical protein n=1 Tax=Nonomuraea sp. NPDC050404 TaxID=3155783 RepID=UPI0033D9E007